jgi:hypothetical protein
MRGGEIVLGGSLVLLGSLPFVIGALFVFSEGFNFAIELARFSFSRANEHQQFFLGWLALNLSSIACGLAFLLGVARKASGAKALAVACILLAVGNGFAKLFVPAVVLLLAAYGANRLVRHGA